MSRTERSRRTAFDARMTTGIVIGITTGTLADTLLLLGQPVRTRLLPTPSSPTVPTAIPRPAVSGGYYYSAMILRIPGLYQEGEAYALGKDGGGAAVVGRTWDSTTSNDTSARFDPPYSLHPYPLAGPNPYINSIAFATTGANGGAKHVGIATFRSNPNDPNETTYLMPSSGTTATAVTWTCTPTPGSRTPGRSVQPE